MWSFGVVLWELFSRAELPYANLNIEQTINLVVSGFKLPQPEGCPDSIYEVMLKCWEPEPAARPAIQDIHLTLTQIWEKNKPDTDASIMGSDSGSL